MTRPEMAAAIADLMDDIESGVVYRDATEYDMLVKYIHLAEEFERRGYDPGWDEFRYSLDDLREIELLMLDDDAAER